MPLYEYRCKNCGGRKATYRPMIESSLPIPCGCGHEAERILSAAAIRSDLPGYSCPVSGKWIEGRKAHEENLRRTGCHVLESGEMEEAKRVRKAADEALENAVAETAAGIVAAMPLEKQQKLGDELTRTDVAIQRG